MGRRYLLRTFGCQMNEHDSERIAGLLESDGMTATDDAANAEIVVFNTCAIRENADNRLYGNLGALKPLKDENPRLRIVVAGCLAQKDQSRIQRKAPWVDVVIGTHALPGLLELIELAERDGPQMDVSEFTEVFPSALPARREVAHHGWVSIAVGCDNNCSFCIVPLVRGPQLSRPVGQIVTEVQGLVASGVVEVTLLGQNVNTYGRDVTVPGRSPRSPFADLLKAVDAVDGLRRLRFTSPHPRDFTPDVIDAMVESPTVCEHIHFPLQSGSDRILRAMRRSYRSARYLDLLARIREAIPGIAVSTDVIVGFPGETDDDFERTMEVVRAAEFDSAFTFQYSPRPGTPAATADDQVPKGVVQERFERLLALQEETSLRKNRALAGRTLEVLVEGSDRKGRLQGRTRTNRLIHFDGDAVAGEFVELRVIAAHPHHLSGEPVRVSTASPVSADRAAAVR